MVSLSSTGEVLGALRTAASVTVTAYLLPAGRVLNALCQAAQGGARVRVRLEGTAYAHAGEVERRNEAAAAALTASGADVELVTPAGGNGEAFVHAKTIVADGVAFLDGRNWPDDGDDTIVRDDFPQDVAMARDAALGIGDRRSPFFATCKRQALWMEAQLLRSRRSDEDVIVETESFGAANGAYEAIDACALSGGHPRLLVCKTELREEPREAAAIARLERDGADVRATAGTEKFCLSGSRGWIGSANATAAFGHPDQLDWGMRTDDAAIVGALRARFEARWTAAVPVTSA